MNPINVSAPGKLNLLGEHIVVYGKPAILSAIDKRCFVTIRTRPDDKIEIISDDLHEKKLVSFTEIIDKTKNAQKEWARFIETNDISLLKQITADTLDYSMICIGETYRYFKKNTSSGFDLTIHSDIPIGAGMGSSAAVAVSIASAVTIFLEREFDKKTINEIAFLCEQKKHGRPSGADTAVSCYGGLIWYEKKDDTASIKPLTFSLSEKIRDNFFILQTGTPIETTGEMIHHVKLQATNRKSQKRIRQIFEDQEILVGELLVTLENGNEGMLMQIIKNGEQNLEKLGVVSVFVSNLMRQIEDLGGAAKICGGGGIKKGTGVVLCYHKDKKIVQKIALDNHLSFEEIQLGSAGIRYD